MERTRQLVRAAVIALTVEKGFAAVTVTDIVQRARINRSTFYRHYLDKQAVLTEYLAEVQSLTAVAASLVEKAAAQTAEKVPAGLLLLIRHVQAHADFYRVMLGQTGDPVFSNRFRQIAETRYGYLLGRQRDPVDPSSPPVAMMLKYISGAGMCAILWWLENDQPCSPEQLATWLGQLSMKSAGLMR